MEENVVNVLMLLIGSNPFPNYLAIRFFGFEEHKLGSELIPKIDSIAFIYTSGANGTKNICENIKRTIGGSYKTFDLDIGNNSRDEEKIQERIQSFIDKNKNEIESIHLNFTGGTKPMSIYSYITLQKENIQTYFSDIDPDNYRIKIKKGLTNLGYLPEGNCDLRHNLKDIQLDQILSIHGFSQKKSSKEIDFYELKDEYFSSNLDQNEFEKLLLGMYNIQNDEDYNKHCL